MVEIGRFGERIAEDAASFRCAACGEMAAVVKVVAGGQPADMGPPLGRQTQQRDGIVVDYFLGTAWQLAESGTLPSVRAALNDDPPDAAVLRRIDWELAPFYCPECARNYCRADWHTSVGYDDGFYDCTMGTCPNGHQHMVDD